MSCQVLAGQLRQGLVIYGTMNTIVTLSYRRHRPFGLPRFQLAVIHSSILILFSFGQLLLLNVLVINKFSFQLIARYIIIILIRLLLH